MLKIWQYTGQVVVYGVFFAAIGYFASSPAYNNLQPDEALIMLSLAHTGKTVGECHERTEAELAELAPNMRVSKVCPRERSPIHVALEIDGKLLYQDILPPSGLKKDGEANTYQRFVVKAGQHELLAKLGDDVKADDYSYETQKTVNLQPAQILVIEFDSQAGGFIMSR